MYRENPAIFWTHDKTRQFYKLGHIMSIHVLLRGFFLSYVDSDKKCFTLIIIPKR